MDQQSSNANMPRDTVETLKQIQKQGLSVSIVKQPPAPFTIPAPSENRTKQNVLPADKTPKSASIIVPRSQTVTENKAQILQTRLSNNAEPRVSTGRIVTQGTFLDTKATQNQSKSNQLTQSENKSFSSSWNVQMSNPDKSQGTTSRPITTTPGNKMQSPCSARVIMPENKTPVSRSSQNMLSETKTQARVTPGQRVPPNQHLIEGKVQTNQDRILNPTSPPEAKVFSNQVRTGQQLIITPDSKTIPVQRVTPLKSADIKNVSQISVNKQDIKTSQVNRMVSQNVKVTSEITQNKARQNFIIKDDIKSNIVTNSPMLVENKINSVRMVANTVDSSCTRTTQSKSSSIQMRLPSNASGNETQTAVVTKKTFLSTVQTITIQSVQGVTDKVILQGTQATSDVIQNASAVFDMATEAPVSNPGTPVSARMSTSKRSSAYSTSPAKKKCVKRAATSTAEMSSKNFEGSNISSSEEGNENAAQLFNNLKKASRTGLTITPVQSSVSSMPSSTSSTVSLVKLPSETVDKDAYRVAFEKAQMGRSPRGKSRARGRRKYFEPVCLTLSSDDEEEHMQAQFNNFSEAFANEAQMFPHESEEGTKSGQSSPAYHDENDPGCDDDPEFPGVTNIQRTPDHHFPGSEDEMDEEEEDEEEERELEDMEAEDEDSMGEEEEEMCPSDEMDEEDEVPPEEEDEQNSIKGSLENVSGVEQPLRCRSVRIGSFKVHPKPTNTMLNVYLASDGISFNAPMVSDSNKIVNITLKPSDITQMLVHFGKCLPILFVVTTPSFAEAVRKSLNMSENKFGYYDPTSNDDKIKKITFLIDTINEEQRRFLKHSFLSEKKVRELDQKTANEILVLSTPSQNQIIVRCEVAQPQPQPISSENLISVTSIQTPVLQTPVKQTPPQPVTRLLTYPPPPQTGGIPITNEDLACLNEGEFLNDAIIDFYLKYLYNEKLSEYHREKTHIFSSYFFPRLTYKPERARPDEIPKNVQMRRHSQVKTWTRHVDIFSKDFIIIPVNQNVHWFLAIVCYPGLVPEAAESPVKLETKANKSCDNVTSSDDQDETKQVKEANSTVDGNNANSDENSVASSSSMFEHEEPDSEETLPDAADSSTHPEKVRRRKEVPCICIFDSLNGPNRSRIVTLLREYLEIEWKMRKGTRKIFDKTTMQGYIMQCPQQNNYSDCGVYVLQYVESFFENPIPYFDSPIPNLSNWFPKEKVGKKRQELKDLILSLQKKYSSTPAVRNTNASENVPSSPAQTLQPDNR